MSKYTIPDYLAFFRILAAVALVILAIADLRQIFSWLLVIGLASDILDGQIARYSNIESRKGAKFDSAADATIFLCAIAGLIIMETGFFSRYIPLLVISFGLYFLQLGLAYYKYGKSTSFHTYSAKTAAIVQGAFLILSSFLEPWEWLFYITIAISIMETVEEIIIIFMLKKAKTNIKGIYWLMKEKQQT